MLWTGKFDFSNNHKNCEWKKETNLKNGKIFNLKQTF